MTDENRSRDLGALLQPMSVDLFAARYWESEPLVIRRHDARFYDGIVTPDGIADLVTTAAAADIELVETNVGGLTAVRRHVTAVEAAQSFGAGATIKLTGVERRHAPLRRLCGSIAEYLGCPVSVNVYCTPPRSKGLGVHRDAHDVIVLQIGGSKHWYVYDAPQILPLKSLPRLSFESAGPLPQAPPGDRPADAPRRSPQTSRRRGIHLEAGDLMYLPRGFAHEAFTGDVCSVHVTLGISVVTWLDLAVIALRRAAADDEQLKRALPLHIRDDTSVRAEAIAAASSHGERMLGQMDFAGAIDELMRSVHVALDALRAPAPTFSFDSTASHDDRTGAAEPSTETDRVVPMAH